MPVRVIASKLEAYHLKPGDLYTTYTPEEIQAYLGKGLVGLPLMMRTNAEGDDVENSGEYVHRVVIELIDDEGQLAIRTRFDPHAPPGVKTWSR